jgi:hypothetical protein
MRKIKWISLLLILFMIISACTPADDTVTVPDPTGTIAITINYTVDPYPIVLFMDIAVDGPYSGPGGVSPYLKVITGMLADLNWAPQIGYSSGLDFNGYLTAWAHGGSEVVDIGQVSGLGSVTNKPNSGWATSCAVALEHGYVVRFKKSKDYATANLPYFYGRIYVTGWLTNVSNEIIGVKVKYQVTF